MATIITIQTQEIIYLLAAGPIQALERMEAVAANTTRQHNRVRLRARLTLKVWFVVNGERIVPRLKSEANGQF